MLLFFVRWFSMVAYSIATLFPGTAHVSILLFRCSWRAYQMHVRTYRGQYRGQIWGNDKIRLRQRLQLQTRFCDINRIYGNLRHPKCAYVSVLPSAPCRKYELLDWSFSILCASRVRAVRPHVLACNNCWRARDGSRYHLHGKIVASVNGGIPLKCSRWTSIWASWKGSRMCASQSIGASRSECPYRWFNSTCTSGTYPLPLFALLTSVTSHRRKSLVEPVQGNAQRISI